MRATQNRRTACTAHRRGGILLEVLLAVAIFAATAALTLRATRDAVAAVERQERLAQANDLAASAMARLEAGVINIADLRGGRVSEDGDGRDPRFTLELTTRRSSYAGMTLVRLTVRDVDGEPGRTGSPPPLVELRQLVRLRGPDADEEYDEDEIVADLDSELGGPRSRWDLGVDDDGF